MRLLERRASREARVYADAQALLDVGVPLEDVLARFPGAEDWLRPMLVIGETAAEQFGAVEADPRFAASLQQAFLASARRPSFVAAPEPQGHWLRTSLAASTVAAAVAALGAMTYGFVTADQSVPGDWNYTLKITKERLEDAFADGDSQVDVQIRQTEARVFELRRLNDRGGLSAGDLAKLQREAQELTEIAGDHPLDETQRARLRGIFEGANLVLAEAERRQPELEPAVASTRKTVADAVAATGAGAVTSITEPTPTPTEPPATETVPPTPTEQASPTPTEPTPAPAPTEVEPSATEAAEGGVTPLAVPGEGSEPDES